MAKEVRMAKDNDVPIFGVYVGGANTSSNLPDGLPRSRTIDWDWKKIASAMYMLNKDISYSALASKSANLSIQNSLE